MTGAGTPAARVALAVLALAIAGVSTARAQPGAAPADLLVRAGAALASGENERAATLAGQVARDSRPIARQDRAEAWRILGQATYALGRHGEAESAFYAYLKLEPDAHLDPALVPPEAVAFFENVRAQHSAELAALRPRAKRRRSMWLNFVPLGGQWQNGERTKMWVLGSAGVILLGTNIASYAFLYSWCGSPGRTSTCDDGQGTESHAGSARRMQVVNIASGVGLAALYAYSVIDGIRGYRRWQAEDASQAPEVPLMSFGLTGDRDSLLLSVGGRF
jgi:hypothetical protein